MWTSLPFQKGDCVRLQGLKSTFYNGQIGSISGFVPLKKRFQVKIGSKTLLVKPENLTMWFSVRYDMLSKYVELLSTKDFASILHAEAYIEELSQEDMSVLENLRFLLHFKTVWASQLLQRGELGDHWCEKSISMLESVISECPFQDIKTFASVRLASSYMCTQRYQDALVLLEPMLEDHYGFYESILGFIIDAKEMLLKDISQYHDRIDVDVISHPFGGGLMARLVAKMKVCISMKEYEGAQNAVDAFDILNLSALSGHSGYLHIRNDTKAKILMASGHFTQALKVIQKSHQDSMLAVGPEVGTADNYFLQCECFIRLGDKKKARKCLKQLRKFSGVPLKQWEGEVRKMKHRCDVDVWKYVFKKCGNPECKAHEKKEREFQVCPDCRLKCYCSKTCWKKHWPIHKKECEGRKKTKKTQEKRFMH